MKKEPKTKPPVSFIGGEIYVRIGNGELPDGPVPKVRPDFSVTRDGFKAYKSYEMVDRGEGVEPSFFGHDQHPPWYQILIEL